MSVTTVKVSLGLVSCHHKTVFKRHALRVLSSALWPLAFSMMSYFWNRTQMFRSPISFKVSALYTNLVWPTHIAGVSYQLQLSFYLCCVVECYDSSDSNSFKGHPVSEYCSGQKSEPIPGSDSFHAPPYLVAVIYKSSTVSYTGTVCWSTVHCFCVCVTVEPLYLHDCL